MPPAIRSEDRFLWIVTLTLVGFGIIMIYNASSVIALKQHGAAGYFLFRQAIWAGIGITALYVVSRLHYRIWQKGVLIVTVMSLLALVMVLMPRYGQEINGASRWIQLGPVSFQTSEFAKFGLVIYLAHYLTKGSEKLGHFIGGLFPALFVVGVALVLILQQPDLGTAVCLGLVAFSMLFIGGARFKHLSYMVLGSMPLLAYLILGTAYRRQRFLTYLDPWQDSSNTGFQITQSYLAFGSGGVSGVGLGAGNQKLFFLPHPHTDFIFSVIGEELGLIGSLAVMLGFVLLIWRGFALANHVSDPFGKYLAFGITLMIGVSALFNMGVATGLLPTKGLTLPLISYGGSSLVAYLMGIGILLSIARHKDRP